MIERKLKMGMIGGGSDAFIGAIHRRAALMDNQIDEKVKKERVSKIINLSKELEQDYFSKFIGKELVFIPEVYKNGYLIGHTGNYILVRALGDEKLLKQDINVKLEKLEYPYVLGCIIIAISSILGIKGLNEKMDLLSIIKQRIKK